MCVFDHRSREVNYMFFADTGKAKGSAFIEFASEDAAQAVCGSGWRTCSAIPR